MSTGTRQAGCVHMKCNDGPTIDEASEVVVHALEDGAILFELFQGPGQLGTRYSMVKVEKDEADKLRTLMGSK